jgi:ParB family chromosome partitioning protein
MRLLNLPTEIQEMIVSGKLSEGHARSLLAIEDPKQQLEAAELVIKNGWTTRQVEEFIRAHKVEASKSTHKAASQVGNTNEYTKSLADYLKTKVIVQSTAKGGKLIIEYRGDDDLQRIFNAIKS